MGVFKKLLLKAVIIKLLLGRVIKSCYKKKKVFNLLIPSDV